MNANDNLCRIPLKAYFEVIDGKPEIVKADYADIPAEAIAKFILDRVGAGKVFGNGGESCDN